MDSQNSVDGLHLLRLENIEVRLVHNPSEEAIIIIHGAVVDRKLRVIGDDNEASPSCFFDPLDLERHAAGESLIAREIYDCEDWWFSDLTLEVHLIEWAATLYFGDDEEFEHAVLDVRYFWLFGKGADGWMREGVLAVSLVPVKVILPERGDSDGVVRRERERRRAKSLII